MATAVLYVLMSYANPLCIATIIARETARFEDARQVLNWGEMENPGRLWRSNHQRQPVSYWQNIR